MLNWTYHPDLGPVVPTVLWIWCWSRTCFAGQRLMIGLCPNPLLLDRPLNSPHPLFCSAMIPRVTLPGRSMRSNLTLDRTTSWRVARRLCSDLSLIWKRNKQAVEFVFYRHQTGAESTLKYIDLWRDLRWRVIYALVRVGKTRSRKTQIQRVR